LLGAQLDVGNQGCRALAASLVKLIIDNRPNARIYLLYGNRTGGALKLRVSGKIVEVEMVNFRLSPRGALREHLLWVLFLACICRLMPITTIRNWIVRSNQRLRVLMAADFVGDIRAGDSFSDIYGVRRFLFGIIPSIIAILMRKKLVLLPQTYGPFKSKVSKQAARFVMRRAVKLYSRDRDSIELVHEMLGEQDKRKSVQFCPDVAFVLESVLPENPDIQPELNRESNIPLIGFNISSMLYREGYTGNNEYGLMFNYKEFVHILLRDLMERTNAHVLLVPHEYFLYKIGSQECNEIHISEKERESTDKKYHDRIHLVKREYNQNEIKGIIGLCDFFVGSRMHACIAALSQCIPAVGIAYSKKFHGVFESIGLSDCVADARTSTKDELLGKIISSFEKREFIRNHLMRTIPSIQREIQNIFRNIYY
jgi:polysaccharide pyruvyl transferase WcaK-like protein